MTVTAKTLHRTADGGRRSGLRLVTAALAALLLVGCQADEISYTGYGPKSERQVSRETRQKMTELDMASSAPVLMRIFKEESTFEVWKRTRSGRFELLKTYEICSWSGKLGPKIREGDRQAPEGYYAITPALMNPNSNYYLAFNTGFPNAYDRANGRSGTHLMVHGACSSRGCYAMTDAQIQEIYALARDAFRGGQRAFQLQAYPFRMTAENMGRHWNDPNITFWKMLKEGYDTFELTRQEPKVDVCGRKYVFNATPKGGAMSPVDACPGLVRPEKLVAALTAKAKADEAKAIVIAARVEADRKADEERKIMLAMEAEAAKQRAAEREIAMAERKQAIASFLGLGDAPPADAVPVIDPTVVATASEGGRPLPRPNPRGPMMALAATEGGEAANRSMFARLFSFGDDTPPPPPAPVATATAEPAAGAPATPARVSTDVAAAGPTAPLPAAVPATATAAAPVPTPAAPAAACAPVAEGAPAGTPPCPVVQAAAPAPEGDESILARIGNWF